MKTEREVLEEAVRDHLRRALTAVESARIALFDLLHADTGPIVAARDMDTAEVLAAVNRAAHEIHSARNRAGVIDG